MTFKSKFKESYLLYLRDLKDFDIYIGGRAAQGIIDAYTDIVLYIVSDNIVETYDKIR